VKLSPLPHLAAALALALSAPPPAAAHEIYSGLHGRNGQLCCGGADCAPTTWRERRGRFEFLTRERGWVEIPEGRITFLPVPGDPAPGADHAAHFCYRAATDADRRGPAAADVFGAIFLYCAFIAPGSI
jgi:hypothetical protein